MKYLQSKNQYGFENKVEGGSKMRSFSDKSLTILAITLTSPHFVLVKNKGEDFHQIQYFLNIMLLYISKHLWKNFACEGYCDQEIFAMLKRKEKAKKKTSLSDKNYRADENIVGRIQNIGKI